MRSWELKGYAKIHYSIEIFVHKGAETVCRICIPILLCIGSNKSYNIACKFV